jgi:predicted DNA-binding transcriptional regulator YafY
MENLIENHAIEQPDFTFRRISAQVERVLFSLDFIARHRFGATLHEVYQSQNERFGICRRTTERDISTMVAVGIVLVRQDDGKQVFSLNPAMKLAPIVGQWR